jgi:hypothetical protein
MALGLSFLDEDVIVTVAAATGHYADEMPRTELIRD